MLVEIPEALEDGTAGVTGAVATLITGAAGAGGFKGLAGRYSRRDLLRYGAAVAGDMRLTRIDSGRAATLSYHAEIVPLTDALGAAMGRALQPGAQPQERAAFAVAWQERVKAILIDHADDPRLVTLAD
ncbi:hypothetical protein GALL_436150 [mine drainage metagenome]|uniref:Uncharacterized protein n=1 Tax=mine drainage metagenome TaxID=410659 RepID=A0A1J5PUB8_9ZZZZ